MMAVLLANVSGKTYLHCHDYHLTMHGNEETSGDFKIIIDLLSHGLNILESTCEYECST